VKISEASAQIRDCSRQKFVPMRYVAFHGGGLWRKKWLLEMEKKNLATNFHG
jgi:hypothetical protein